MGDSPTQQPVPVKDYSVLIDPELGQLWPKFAEKYKFDENPLWASTELTIIWRTISPDYYELAVEFARQYVLPQNYPTKQLWVKDLHIKDSTEGKPIVYPGVWRFVTAGFDTKKQGDPGVLLTLRQGFAEKIAWDEALQIQAVELETAPGVLNATAQDERYIMVVFPNFDPLFVDAAVQDMRASQHVEDPTIQGRVRTGDWEYALIKPEKQQDGSFFITVMLSRPQFTMKTFEHYSTPEQIDIIHLWGVPKRLAQALVDSYKIEGRAATAGYSPNEGLSASTVDVEIRQGIDTTFIIYVQTANNCDYNEWTSYYYGFTLQDAKDTISMFMLSRAVGDTITTSVPSLMGNGKYSFETRRRTSIASAQRFSIPTGKGGITQEHVYAHNQRIPNFNNVSEPFEIPTAIFMLLHTEHTLKPTYKFDLTGFRKNDDCTFSWSSMVYGPVGLDPAADPIVWTVYGEVVYQQRLDSGASYPVYIMQSSYHQYKHTLKGYDTQQEAYTAISGVQLDGTQVGGSDGGGWWAETVSDDGWTAFKDIGT